MNLKEIVNGNQAWIRYASVVLAFTIFLIAQSTASGKKTEKIDNLEKADIEIKADAKAVKEDIQQIQLDVNSIQKDVEHTKEDVSEIKEDNKQIIQLLREIKDSP